MNRAGALTLLASLACSPAEGAGASGEAVVDTTAMAVAAPATATNDLLPAGEYVCYFYGHYLALESSSLTSMRILGPGRYEALGEKGRFTYDETSGALSFSDGGLAGYPAHRKQSGKQPAIVFIRKELEAAGLKRIDLSDTWCYHDGESR